MAERAQTTDLLEKAFRHYPNELSELRDRAHAVWPNSDVDGILREHLQRFVELPKGAWQHVAGPYIFLDSVLRGTEEVGTNT